MTVPVPQPGRFCSPVLREEQEIFAHLFFIKDDAEPKYHSSFSGDFSSIESAVSSAIQNIKFDSQVFIGLMGANHTSEAKKVSEFFSRLSNLKDVSIIILSDSFNRKISRNDFVLFLQLNL